MTDILIIAFAGYFMLNCTLAFLAMALNWFMRYDAGLQIIEFREPSEVTAKEIAKDLTESLLSAFLVVFVFIPLLVYLAAGVMAEQVVVKKRKKRKKKKKEADKW